MDLLQTKNKSKSKTKSKSVSKSASKSKSKSLPKSKCAPEIKSQNNNGGNGGNVESKIKSYIKLPVEPYVFYDAFLEDAQKAAFQKPIGIFDPHGENINPLSGLPYQNLYIDDKPIKYDSGPLEGKQVPNTYRNWSYIWTNLPLYVKVGEIINSIRNHNMTIIKAGTGTGKSFLAGRICSQAFNFQKKILMTLPKKILARETAQMTSRSCDVLVGEEVGYMFKGAYEIDKNGKESKIIFTTTGTLVRRITGDDPLLREYSCIIIDEAHERSVQTDQIILFLKKALAERSDLKVVFISATLDEQLFMNYFKDYSCNLVELPPTIATFPVQDIYEKKVPEDWQKTALEKVMMILRSGECGDILVFIKSGADGRKMMDALRPQFKMLPDQNENPFMTILDASVTKEEQEYATKEFDYLTHPDADPARPFTRKIVFSTNVAESSLTVKGAVFVVDCGLALEDLYEPRRDANALLEKFVSQSAIKQRRGRVGRTKPGICYHLYSEAEMKKFPEFPIPSIQKSDLTLDLLDMMKIEYVKNVGDLKKLLASMISPPSQIFIDSALHNLFANGAITSKSDDGTITDLGRAYSQFSGLSIQMARAIIASYYYHCKYDVIPIMVIMMDIDGRMDGIYARFKPRYKMNEAEFAKEVKAYEKKQHQFDSASGDFMTIYNIYQAFREYMRIPKTLAPEPTGPMNGAGKNNNNNGNETNNVPEVIPIEQLTKKTEADARRWCIENGISPRVFVDSRNKKSWDKVGNEVRKIENTLMKIVSPPELRRMYFEKYKEEGGIANKRQLEKEIEASKKESKMIVPAEDRINAPEIDKVSIQDKSVMNEVVEGGAKKKSKSKKSKRSRSPHYEDHSQVINSYNESREDYKALNYSPNTSKESIQNKSMMNEIAMRGGGPSLIQQYIQYGGYNAKPFEINYFPNAVMYEKKEDNILASIAHGYYTHMVKHINKNFYSTCFPLEPVMCYPDMNSTVSLKAKPKYLIYNELFMLRENQPTLKLNIVNKLPAKIQADVKTFYGKLIENCYKKSVAKKSTNGKKSRNGKKKFTKKKFLKKHYHRR